MKRLVFVLFLMCSIGFAQTYPKDENIMETKWEAYTPALTAPEYLVPFTNSFGNQVTRVSDVEVIGGDTQQLRHHYSKDSPWNSDETLIKLAGFPAAILDGNTYKFIKWAKIPSSATWSNTNPNLMYGTKGNRLVSFNIIINVSQTIHTFRDFQTISYGYNEGNMSYDDRYIGLIGENFNNVTLIVFDILNSTIVGTKFLGSKEGLDWFSVSPLGNYAIVSWQPDGNADNQGLKVYDLDFTNKRHLTDYTTHADLGIDVDGNEVYVAFGDEETRANNYYVKMIRLSDGLITPLFEYTEAYGVWGGHISCRNTNRPGWAYISEGCCKTIGEKEILAIKLDSSNTIERFGVHHATYHDSYEQGAQAVPNRDGTKIMFASSWDCLFTTKYPPAFIVEKK
ncbi:T9SS C-terminal target domain-containing protein [Xanthomarina sp. F1114]|uniref:T9SS C-terminal target domain-containing protein n=1 Tax=Xanthomarina sp. F1114 TaxID=2996019 RepID=UPI00225E57BC|nr:T9SS C-terminal target domain-containing protein [Xanthomarina sp. F1114]MCX7547244.1 T9SS C-terminal target domain-containing protein [Xanthomarina sp. F1114]